VGYWKLLLPESTTNLVVNPSVETATTGYSASGSNTIARSTTAQMFGAYSLACTYQNNLTLATFGSITLTAVRYTFSAWVYLASNWNGGAVSVGVTGFTSVVINTASTTTTETGKWVRLEIDFTPNAGDLAGSLTILAASAPSAGRIVYVDGLQVEAKSYATTYCDGDQPGCRWLGAAHASASERDENEARGGQLVDLKDDLGFPVGLAAGIGAPPLVNLASEMALQDGALYEGTRALARVFSLRALVKGDTLAAYHAVRQALVKAVNSRTAITPQERVLRYSGAAVEKEIYAVYDGGLEMASRRGFAEEVTLRWRANDPRFYQVGERAAALDIADSATFRYVAARRNGVWDALGPPNAAGTYNSVRAVLVTDGFAYFGGDFLNFDNIANADYIVRYNLADGTRANLGTGADGVVRALARASNGDIFAAGAFTTIGGVTTRGVARWNGSTWAALGPPSSGGDVYAIAVSPSGTVYVGGSFSNWAGNANADFLAAWDGSSWFAPASTPANAAVNAFAFALDGKLYIGGSFSAINGLAAPYIAVYNPSDVSFARVGAGDFNGQVNALLAMPDGSVYATGTFTTYGGAPMLRLARWNGVTWDSVGGGLTVDGVSLARYGTTGVLVGMNNGGVKLWDGGQWQELDFLSASGFPYVGAVTATADGDIFLGMSNTGTFEYAGMTTIPYGGTDRAYPVIRVKRTGGSSAALYSVRNETTGAALFFAYYLSDGEELTIDLRPGRQGVTSNLYGPRNALLPASNVSTFFLAPGNGAAARDNRISAFVYTSGSPTVEMTLRWRDTYASAD
jgi:hypothetical protein